MPRPKKIHPLALCIRLGLKLGEEFKIVRNGELDINNMYKFKDTGLMVKHRRNGEWWPDFDFILRELSEGQSQIIKQ